jgi:hypothetical protein
MKLLVAIPVYDGKLQVQTVAALLTEQLIAIAGGDEFHVSMLPACSHPAMGRNQLANEFLKSGFDRLFFLDADVTFEPGALMKLAKSKADLVGGAYRFKKPEEEYPVGFLPDPEDKGLQANESGHLEVEFLPGGFMAISRKVFETLIERNPARKYEHQGHHHHCFFEMPYLNGSLFGEDAYFCRSWREAGGQVFLDPELKLTHWDFNRPYEGHIGAWLQNRPCN